MLQPSVSVNDMLTYLVLDQCIGKFELVRIIKTTIQKLNQENFNDKQRSRIEKLYWRMKDYEDQWSLYHNANGNYMDSAS
jgi:hypothetical protein